MKFTYKPVTNDVFQWLILGSKRFNTFTDDPDHRILRTLAKYADTKNKQTKNLRGVVDEPHGYAGIQRDVSNLQKQTLGQE